MTELIPKKLESKIKDILNPINPGLSDTIINFLVHLTKDMFRELSEMRSAGEGEARQVLSSHEEKLLDKLNELLPNYPDLVNDLFLMCREVLEKHFERQRGLKYK